MYVGTGRPSRNRQTHGIADGFVYSLTPLGDCAADRNRPMCNDSLLFFLLGRRAVAVDGHGDGGRDGRGMEWEGGVGHEGTGKGKGGRR